MSESSPEFGLALDEQLCFAVYAASRAVTARYRPLLGRLGLTYPQYLVMLVLWEGRSVSVSALGERLQLDSGTLSPLLKRLEGLGLIERRRRVDDERSVEVSLSETGLRMREDAACVPGQIAEAMGLSAGQLSGLRDSLLALGEHLRAD